MRSSLQVLSRILLWFCYRKRKDHKLCHGECMGHSPQSRMNRLNELSELLELGWTMNHTGSVGPCVDLGSVPWPL